MNINHFSYFIETVRENSITRAAESLFISQSTISKAIKNLEQTYNTELIDRKARKFKLTSAGEIFYNSAVKIVSNYQAETEVLATLLHSQRGKLILGIPPCYGNGHSFAFTSISADVSRNHPANYGNRSPNRCFADTGRCRRYRHYHRAF